MTEQSKEAGAAAAPSPAEANGTEPLTANKAFWMSIGVGSAALVAALMYATKRPKRRR
ncbi:MULTISPECIES: hypothetical protein [Sphingobium]|uniref:LPXTG cell wall anchor domain-containing protein n=1 Tax=Sphingobium lignivorans TaxID=2735886 RepID=A0ABR6NH99_9SPHN|nr:MULTISPECIES: hypothetical protein [Sphingobium]MBB5985569.1 hypothetical protein [Sphingobium lignivorans]BAK66189.1 hypothetical protein SLG_15140 [Sphingobium sp. SYK-6]